jgi:hypothetical protein
MTKQVHGKEPFFFSIQPSLPGGLVLNPESGTISGTAAAPLVQTQFVVSCHNNESHQQHGAPATTTLTITVLEVAVSGWSTKHYADGSVYTGGIPRACAFVCILFSACACAFAVDGLACTCVTSEFPHLGTVLFGRYGPLNFWHAHCCRFRAHCRQHCNHVPYHFAPCSPGNLSDGAWHGRGTLRLATGDVYRGNWHQSLRHGQGDQVWAARRCTHEPSGLLGHRHPCPHARKACVCLLPAHLSVLRFHLLPFPDARKACVCLLPAHLSVLRFRLLPFLVCARGRSGAATRDIRESSCTTRGAVMASCATKMAMSTPGAG